MASKILKAPVELLMARVLLHDTGHFLMIKTKPLEAEEAILDDQGHIKSELTPDRIFIMSGIGKSSWLERRFIKNLRWHSVVQRIIGRYF
jgi:hypothetical protein